MKARSIQAVLLVVLAGCAMDDSMSMSEDWANNANKNGYPPGPTTNPADGDKYEAPGTNRFVVASHDPLSTFAADVDTASYDIFRRDISELGQLPNPDSVRLEEYVNYFPYKHRGPSADAKEPFIVTLRAASNPFEKTTLMSIGIKGKVVDQEKRPAANIVFLIDTSGSMMSVNKLPLVKKLLLESLEMLGPEDFLSIVTYAGSTRVALPPTSIDDRATITAAIESLSSGGSTAGAAGIELAYAQAEKGFIPDGINHVMLCTDGDFNVGLSGDEALVALIEQKRKSGVTLTAIGVGYGNLNDSMMEKVSNAGNGNYSVISSEDQAIDYVHKRMFGNFNLIAKDVKIQVEFNPAKVHAYRLLGYENRALRDDQFKDDKVDAGEIGSGHTVTALYELVLAGNAIPEATGAPDPRDGEASDHVLEVPAGELCSVRIRYKAPNATEQDPAAQIEQGLSPDHVASNMDAASSDLQWAAAIATFAEILKQSPYAKPDALASIEEIITGNAGDDADRLEFVELFKKARSLLENK